MTPSPARPASTTDRVAIIGAGPAGLTTARALKTLGLPYTIFERHNDVGGIWDPTNGTSPIYHSAHFISSRTMSGHEGFPMPETYPDYPSNQQILAYIRDFATRFGLRDDIQTDTQITAVAPTEGGWTLDITQNGQTRSESFRWLVCASGTNWHPNRPTLKGEDSFTGEILHSIDYHHSDSLKGQRVVVVGAGNSGVDIACDAAFAADTAYFSLRRGYHFIPKHIFGTPSDVFASQSNWIPLWINQRVFGTMLRLLNGDLSRLGLPKPDHRVFESHPIMNTQILHHLQHGNISAKPDIDHLDGDTVTFTDGTAVETDKIILATGYHWHLPYLPHGLIPMTNDRPESFLKIFNQPHPTLFLNGFVETNSGAYKLFDEMALLIAKTVESQIRNPAQAARIQTYIETEKPDLGGKVSYIPTPRHSGYTNVIAYRKALAAMRDQFNWPTPEDFYH